MLNKYQDLLKIDFIDIEDNMLFVFDVFEEHQIVLDLNTFLKNELLFENSHRNASLIHNNKT